MPLMAHFHPPLSERRSWEGFQYLWAGAIVEYLNDGIFADEIEVQILSTSAGLTLVAAIELLSPANNDRPQSRKAFVAKCVSYLSQGIGVVIADIVTNRRANLHNELVTYLGQPTRFLMPADVHTYAVAYRPSRRPDGDRIEVWPVSLGIGSTLPTLDLALRNAETVPLDLEATYLEACRHSRLI
ncbi:MAG: DUF4058 family protein [Gemmataceae bacterium]